MSFPTAVITSRKVGAGETALTDRHDKRARMKAGTAKAKTASPTGIAKDPESTAKALEPLAGSSEAIDRFLAKHPKAGAALLKRLSHSSDKTTRKYVCLNPNTSKETLVKLAHQFPGGFFRNPAFDWLLLEDPNLLFDIGGRVLKYILMRPDCPQSFLTWAVSHGSEQEKLAVTMNPEASIITLKKLAKARGEVGRGARAHVRMKNVSKRHSATQTPNVATLLSDVVKEGLRKLAYWKTRRYWQRRYLGPSQWLWLRLDTRLEVLYLPNEVFYREWHLRHPEEFRAQCRNNYSMKQWEQNFAESSSGELKAHSLEYREEMLLGNIQQVAEQVRAVGITPALLQELDQDWKLRSKLLLSADCPHILLEHFARHQNEKRRLAVAENPACPPDLHRLLGSDRESRVRQAVAGNPACPSDLIALLATDKSIGVRSTVARRNISPPHVFEHLADDANSRVRQALAGNPACPPNILIRLSDDMGGVVAGNPSSPPELLEYLFDETVRFPGFWINKRLLENLLANPACPPGVIVRMADTFPSLRRTIASSANCPIALLEVFAQSANFDVLLALTRNPSTPEALRQSLFQRLVATASKSNLQYLANSQIDSNLVTEWAGARLWWLSIKALAKNYSSESVLDELADGEDLSELTRLFHAEATCLLTNPMASLAARVIDADDVNVLKVPPSVADSACRHTEDAIRLIGLSQPHASPSQLARHIQSTDWKKRLAIASNPGCPSGLLKRLLADAHSTVATQARMTLEARVRTNQIG